MAIDTTRDLFIYELGVLREIETSGLRMLDYLVHQVHDENLRQIVQSEQQECRQLGERLNFCAQAIGTSLARTRADTVGGIYDRFENFVRSNPTPGIMDQFALDTLIRFLYLGMAAHKTLIDWAILMNESQCVQCLHANLVQKQESAAKVERYSHELGVRLLTAAGQPA